ncbi:hypothetical protein ANCCAN_01159 [Ancylostoma caninum]|uniref:Uncharacterized protein n=1 Tax=Ancylostoma caninum TaxID=29170 RepID=A0A368H865_ANCCA|nr:hypothetical protein ANCCAN_01159 [Ancylostoma caninum]
MFSCITRLVLNAKLSNPQGKDGRGDVKLTLNDRQREKKKCKCGPEWLSCSADLCTSRRSFPLST